MNITAINFRSNIFDLVFLFIPKIFYNTISCSICFFEAAIYGFCHQNRWVGCFSGFP